ncbi:MAG: hypothetical protein J7507_12020 [Pseudoxanthomonas sp.]|nr:hypothetical protein [Pseudoxanthomonas sp.]
MAPDTYVAGSRPSFRERVHALAGHTTFREPAGGRSTVARPVPTDHLIAAALAYGRRGPADIGPDVAFDMATGRDGHRRQVQRWLGGVLAADRTAACRRLRPLAAVYATWAYGSAVLGLPFPPAPRGVAEKDHGEVALYACLLLDRAAEDALALASRRV